MRDSDAGTEILNLGKDFPAVSTETWEAAIAKDRAPEFSNIIRSLYPVRCLRIKAAELLQLLILFFRQ